MSKINVPKREIRAEVVSERDLQGERVVRLTLSAPDTLFGLCDTLAASGAIPAIERELVREAKQALLSYLESGQTWIDESKRLRK